MQFDARDAKALPPGERIIVDQCPGLRLEASASRRTWIYRYKSPVDGNMRQVALGHWPAMTFVSAMAEWERKRAERDAGVDLSRAKRAARVAAAVPAEAGYSVAKLCQDYLVGHIKPSRKPKGAAEVERQFTKLLGPIASVQAAALKRAQAFDLLEGLADRPVLAGQLRQELGAAWDYALDAGRIPEETANWWRQIMRGKLKSKGKKISGVKIGTAKRVLSQPEVGQLVNWLPNFSKTVLDVLTLYLWTGARGAELVQMERREITEETDGLWWTLPKAKTKNARHEEATDFRVPLIGRAETIVRRRMAQSAGFLFPSTSPEGHLQQKSVQVAVYFFQPYCKTTPSAIRARLPVTHWAPHDLRRTVRTMLASMGCPMEVGEAILGHMLDGVNGVYNLHHYDPERRVWLTRLDARLEELAAAALAPGG